MQKARAHIFDRRCGRDIWSRVLIGLNVSVWLLVIGFLIVIEMAKPQYETFFDRFYRLGLRTEWDFEAFFYLYYLIAAGLVISIAGFCLSSVRARRKTDYSCTSFLILWVISFAGFAVLRLCLL